MCSHPRLKLFAPDPIKFAIKKTIRQRFTSGALPAITLIAAFTVTPWFGGVATAAAPEKADLKFGFIKLTDCAPIIIAKELNYSEDEGLYVTVEAQSNWKILLDRVISGELDGAHMLAGRHWLFFGDQRTTTDFL